VDMAENDKIEAHFIPSFEHEERRKWSRVPDDKRSRVWFSTPMLGAQYGDVEEISLGGFSMVALGASAPQVGEQIVVGFDEWLIPVRVKYVSETNGDYYRVGMEWVRPESPAVKTLLRRRVER